MDNQSDSSPGEPPARGRSALPAVSNLLAGTRTAAGQLAGIGRRLTGGSGTRVALVTATPVAVSVLSLVLSIYALIAARAEPDVAMSMPDRVRVAQGGTEAWLYLQPRFVSTGRNDRVEVIKEITVTVKEADGKEFEFVWNEQGDWQYSFNPQAGGALTWRYLADPAPLVVGPTSPQLPMTLFYSPPGWTWQPGTYQVTVIAERAIRHKSLCASFTIVLTPDVVDALGPELRQFRVAPTTLLEDSCDS